MKSIKKSLRNVNHLRGKVNQPWRTKDWFVSPWNYSKPLKNLPKNLSLHDITLRDGEQFPGIELNPRDRLRIIESLVETGIQRIEGGRISGIEEKNSTVKEIVNLKTGVPIFGLIEMSVEDIHRAAECGVDGVVVVFPSREELMIECLKMEVEQVVDIVVKMLQAAKRYNMHRVLFPTEFTRAKPSFYRTIIQKIEKAVGFESLTIVDSVGVCSPIAIPYMVQFAKTVTDKPIEVHFHNDFGMATANTIIALTCGAEVAHTSILGLGERVGNASFEEVSLILLTMFQRDLNIKTERIFALSSLVQEITGFKKAVNAPLIGRDIYKIKGELNLLKYFSSEDNHAMTNTFPYRWDLVGHPQPEMVLGMDNGLASLEMVLKKIGVLLTPEEKERLLELIHRRAEQKKTFLSLNDVEMLVRDLQKG